MAKLSVMTMEVSEAAQRLGVSVRQVQNLVARGELRQVARGLVERASVDRLQAVRAGSHRRAWSQETAWGAVALLSGAQADWMGVSQRSRLKARLRQLSASELVERTRGRAEVTRYRAHSSASAHLSKELVRDVDAAARLNLSESNDVDGYLAVGDLESVVSRHGLIRDSDGRVTLRATFMDLAIVKELSERSIVLSALDLAESLDVREHAAGRDALAAALGELHV